MMAPYRPPGRSNRSGRTNVDNDVFEGLPVKQWAHSYTRVSLARPSLEAQQEQDEKRADLPMPRDYQLLQPWTQHLLRLARSGKVGTKRKQTSDTTDDDRPDDDATDEAAKPASSDERGFMAKKWKHIPEHALVPEHRHYEFLAKRRKGMPNLYSPDEQSGAFMSMRKTKIQRADANGDMALYDVLVPEGQALVGEITNSTELPDLKPVIAAPGTIIDGVGVANEEGVFVAQHLRPPTTARRARPPPKKKGGPGRGKKRVTFTNPDGSTYTKIVPNATKIIPQSGQIFKHVTKVEETSTTATVVESTAEVTTQPNENGDEGSGSDEGDDDGDDDDREEGEISDDDTVGTGAATPAAKVSTPSKAITPAHTAEKEGEQAMEDVKMTANETDVQLANSETDIQMTNSETDMETGKSEADGQTAPIETDVQMVQSETDDVQMVQSETNDVQMVQSETNDVQMVPSETDGRIASRDAAAVLTAKREDDDSTAKSETDSSTENGKGENLTLPSPAEFLKPHERSISLDVPPASSNHIKAGSLTPPLPISHHAPPTSSKSVDVELTDTSKVEADQRDQEEEEEDEEEEDEEEEEEEDEDEVTVAKPDALETEKADDVDDLLGHLERYTQPAA